MEVILRFRDLPSWTEESQKQPPRPSFPWFSWFSLLLVVWLFIFVFLSVFPSCPSDRAANPCYFGHFPLVVRCIRHQSFFKAMYAFGRDYSPSPEALWSLCCKRSQTEGVRQTSDKKWYNSHVQGVDNPKGPKLEKKNSLAWNFQSRLNFNPGGRSCFFQSLGP